MRRYNLFHPIHKGLKALLYDTGLLLQRTDYALEEDAKKAIRRLRFALRLFKKFQFAEDASVLPAIATYEPGIADSFEQDHKEANQLGENLESLLGDFQNLLLAPEKVAVGPKIIRRYEEFMLFNTHHMAREEQVLNKILWRYYTDAELQQLAWQIISGSGASFQKFYTGWMFRALNNAEMVRWVKEMKDAAQEEEFCLLLENAQALLHPRRWNLLQLLLSTSAMPASVGIEN